MMQVFVISVQNAVARARIGSATALGTFSRQIGATIGVTVMGVIVNHGLPAAAAAERRRADPPAAGGAARRARGGDPAGVPRRDARRRWSCG